MNKIKCIECHIDKPINKFYKNKRSKNGVLNTCKDCRKAYRYYFGGNRIKTLERDKYTCVECGMNNEEHIRKWKRGITVDHIDGNGRNSEIKNNDLDNLQTLCLCCHGKKDRKRSKQGQKP